MTTARPLTPHPRRNRTHLQTTLCPTSTASPSTHKPNQCRHDHPRRRDSASSHTTPQVLQQLEAGPSKSPTPPPRPYANMSATSATSYSCLHHLAPPPPRIQFTDKYRRLGDPVTSPTNVADETHHKAAQPSAATESVPANLLKLLTPPQRLHVLDALAASTLLCATEAWTITSHRHLTPMSRALHNICAKALAPACEHRRQFDITDPQRHFNRGCHVNEAPSISTTTLHICTHLPPCAYLRPQHSHTMGSAHVSLHSMAPPTCT